jgi:hypothetical protein
MASTIGVTLSNSGQQLKEQLLFFRNLFAHIAIKWPRPCAGPIEPAPNGETFNGIPLNIMEMRERAIGRYFCWNSETLPGATPELVTAAQKKFLCDTSVWLLIDTLNRVFEESGVQFRAATMAARPQLFLRIGNFDIATSHTIFLVTDNDRREYIMDLTAEQFGFFEENSWFLPAEDYLSRYMSPDSELVLGLSEGFLELSWDNEERAMEYFEPRWELRRILRSAPLQRFMDMDEGEKDAELNNLCNRIDEELENVKDRRVDRALERLE